MLSLIAFIFGAIWGTLVARKRGGNRLDTIQFAAVYGIACALVSIIGYIIAFRMGWI